jgi:chromosome partitioning protein
MAQILDQAFYLRLNDLAEMLKHSSEKLNKELQKQKIQIILSQGKALIEPTNVRKFLKSKGYQYHHQVISFQMLKGGVAKTTSCLNIGLRAAMYGHRVLFLDLDQQANLSFALGIDDLEIPVFVDVLEKKCVLEKAIKKISPFISLLPSNLNNSVIERVLLQSYRNLAKVVSGPIESIKNEYDLILIDTAPSLSALNTAVSCASTQVVLPVNPDKFTLFGVQKHLADLEQIKKDFGVQFAERIMFTKFDSRESSSQIYLEQCLDVFGKKMLDTYIRNTTEIKNAIASRKTIFESTGYGKDDYDMATRELMALW